MRRLSSLPLLAGLVLAFLAAPHLACAQADADSAALRPLAPLPASAASAGVPPLRLDTLRLARLRAAVTGIVTDSATGEALPGVHVFVARSTRGTVTDAEGRFRLPNLTPGAARVVASMVGYKARVRPQWLRPGRTTPLDLRLHPDTLALDGVTVTAERDGDFWKHLRRFTDKLIGEAPQAALCSLRTPEVLSFDTRWWGRLRAEARDLLVIDNHALGYRLSYALTDFETSGGHTKWDGEPLFEPLPSADTTGAADTAGAARWQQARDAAYYGSLRHFLHALVADTLSEAGFRMRWLPNTAGLRRGGASERFDIERGRILRPAGDTLWALSFRGRLEVEYVREPEDPAYPAWTWRRDRRPHRTQVSWMDLETRPVHVNPRTGEIVEPFGAVVSGYWAYDRLCALLPRTYRPRRAAREPR